MGAVKIRAADKWFSLCIRQRSRWCCDRCGTYYPEGKRMGLHASHFHGRGSWSCRFSPDNCFSHCYGCHQYLGSNPQLFSQWVEDRIGKGAMELLLEKKNDLALGRVNKRAEKEISKHYRQQYRLMAEDPNHKLIAW